MQKEKCRVLPRETRHFGRQTTAFLQGETRLLVDNHGIWSAKAAALSKQCPQGFFNAFHGDDDD